MKMLLLMMMMTMMMMTMNKRQRCHLQPEVLRKYAALPTRTRER
jgi:hypothetical protein